MSEKQPELLPTPRSDAARISVTNGTGTRPGDIVSVQFARQLERELNEALDALKAIASCTFPQRGPGGGAQIQMSALDMAKLAGDALMKAHGETTRQSQIVGVEFRVLENKEIIREGDEFLQDDAVTWVRAGDESGTRLMVGCKHSTAFFKPIRRRITPNDSGKEGGE